MPKRICLIYDCLFPYTVGGGERWYRSLAERLAADGHDVTYLTLRQWPRGEQPDLPGVRVVTAGPRMALYVNGRRRILPPLVFGAGVLLHLLRHGRSYDVVHTASFPYFSLLAAALLRRLGRYRLMVDWWEVWTRSYWDEYLGRVGGLVGWAIQRLCVRLEQTAFAYSRLCVRRLREEGLRGEPLVPGGIYDGPLDVERRTDAEPVVVFAGRHIPEKRAPSVVPAFARARERVPELRCEIYGDGPERGEVLRLIRQCEVEDAVNAPGFVEGDVVAEALGRGLCMVLPSRREGYGLVVIEAAVRGTPSVVVKDPDNAAAELVEDGVNGVYAESADPEELAKAIVRVHEAGPELRRSTAEWVERNGERLSIGRTLENISHAYEAV